MNRLHDFINNCTCDALILSHYTDMRYSAGYAPDWGYYLYVGDSSYLVTDGRFVLQAKAYLTNDYTIIEADSASVYDIIRGLLDNHSVATLAYSSNMSYSSHNRLVGELKNYTILDVCDDLANIRMTKLDDEIDNIIMAQNIAERALQALIDSGDITAGVTELQIAAKLEYLMRIFGSEGASFDSIVAFGSSTAFAHAKPTTAELKIGDFILFDFGATYNGYCSDMTRTFVYKQASKSQIDIYNAVLSANITAINSIKEGVSSCDVGRVARESLSKVGYETYFNHSLGHGVGLEIHENPRLSSSGNGIALMSNMVITVEPGVYIEGVGGVRIEDMIVVTKDGYRNITSFSKELIVL